MRAIRKSVELLFEIERQLRSAAEAYAGERTYTTSKALRQAAINYAKAAREFET